MSATTPIMDPSASVVSSAASIGRACANAPGLPSAAALAVANLPCPFCSQLIEVNGDLVQVDEQIQIHLAKHCPAVLPSAKSTLVKMATLVVVLAAIWILLRSCLPRESVWFRFCTLLSGVASA